MLFTQFSWLSSSSCIKMKRWRNRVAVVTGASSGIGAACVQDLLKAGMIVVGLARRDNRIIEILESLPIELHKNLHAMKCDVSKEEDITNAFNWIENNLGGVDVLINNAGIFRQTSIISNNNTDDLRDTLSINVLGVAICTREAFHSMKKRNIDGHVIIINSLSGHRVANTGSTLSSNMYAPSKFAVTAMVDVLRQEFLTNKTKIKITSISPGFVNTEFISAELRDVMKNKPSLQPNDISAAVLYCISNTTPCSDT